MRFLSYRTLVPLFGLTVALSTTWAADNPFLGGWELTIPGGGAGWLGVEEVNGQLKASLLWGGGSVLPLSSAKLEGDRLVVTRKNSSQRKDENGKNVTVFTTETITASVDGDALKLTTIKPRPNGQGEEKADFSGRREPPMPPAPDLSQVKFADPIQLFNGKDLTGWRLTDPHAASGWSAKDGLLVNEVPQDKSKPHKNYGNLRTDREFEDFNLALEVRLAKAVTAASIYAASMRSRWPTRTGGRSTRTTWEASTAASNPPSPPRSPPANGKPWTSPSWTATSRSS